MQECRQVVFEKLKKAGIEYELIEHPAMHTIEEMEALELNNKKEINKNLFLRDDKKKRYLLLMLSQDKKVDLKELSAKINSRPLGFASEADLQTYLGLSKGAVTPFGVLNDERRSVEVLIDKSLLRNQRVGVHPNDNTATVFLKLKDLERVITEHGNRFEYIEIGACYGTHD
ncbi:MAG: prolyl-tRNA synthetase associated domain-containing protein [Anaerovoracaceae bacterium]|jgi:Ala-tRNA(Pro) deacylase